MAGCALDHSTSETRGGALRAGVLAALWIAAAAGPTWGQDYVKSPCPAGAPPQFGNHLQSLWYRRFWTGSCKDLPMLRCHSGSPSWNEAVHTLLARAPAAERSQMAPRVCRLGRRVGFEWSRPRDERRIDLADLRAFGAAYKKAPNVEAGLSAVEALVSAKIGP